MQYVLAHSIPDTRILFYTTYTSKFGIVYKYPHTVEKLKFPLGYRAISWPFLIAFMRYRSEFCFFLKLPVYGKRYIGTISNFLVAMALLSVKRPFLVSVRGAIKSRKRLETCGGYR